MAKGTLQIKYEELVLDNLDQKERIEELEAALKAIWPFIEEDFPKGTGEDHGTCATDKYVIAARLIERTLEGK